MSFNWISRAARAVAAVSVTAALALTAAGCSSDPGGTPSGGEVRTVADIEESGVVRIGVFSDKAPFGYVDDQGDFAGYDVVYANRIAQDLGVKPEFVSVDPAARVEFLESKKVDIILANFTVTPERAEKVDFANPYFKVSLGVVSPDKNVITDVAQLNGKKLIVVKGTTAETYFEKNHPEVELVKYDQYNEAYSALQDGRGDAFSTDNTEVLAWSLSNPGFTTGIAKLGDTDVIAGAVVKGNSDLLEWLNEHLVTLGKERFFHRNYEQTLAPVYGEAADPDDLVVEGGKP
jgi:polar amino acid transport system substrate-binding protein